MIALSQLNALQAIACGDTSPYRRAATLALCTAYRTLWFQVQAAEADADDSRRWLADLDVRNLDLADQLRQARDAAVFFEQRAAMFEAAVRSHRDRAHAGGRPRNVDLWATLDDDAGDTAGAA